MTTPSTETSRRLFERARDVMVEGVSSPSRGQLNYGEHPIFLRRGEGAYVEDVDGNRYVDLMMAYGALLLGHLDPAIRAALHEAADAGTLFAAVSEPEVDVAELITTRVPGVERVRFANTGTEATMAALRLARGLTGRRRFIKFEGHYHGWYDDYLVSAHPHPVADLGLETDPIAIPESSGLEAHAVQQAILVPWNNLDRLEDALRRHRDEVACIITEPVMANMGVIPPEPGYLEGLQALARQYDTLFILDETVTGFRLSEGGAARRYHLTPDILTFGKGLGAGLPVAAIAGPAATLDGFRWGGVLHYGTQNASFIGMMVARANLWALTAEVYEHVDRIAAAVEDGLKELLRRHHVTGRVQRVGAMLQIFFGTADPIRDYRDFCALVDRQMFQRFAWSMIRHGVYMSPSASLHSIISKAHQLEHVEKVLAAADASLAEVAGS